MDAGGQRKAALLRQLNAVRADIHRIREQTRDRRRAARPGPLNLTHHAQQVIVAVCALSWYDTTVAAQKLLTYKSVSQAGTTLEQARRVVEDLFQQLPDGFSADVERPDTADMRRIATAAKRFIAESERQRWVEQQNLCQGVAPGSVVARDQYEQSLARHGVVPAAIPAKGARQWIRRWCTRMGGEARQGRAAGALE